MAIVSNSTAAVTGTSALLSSRRVALPDIAELFDKNFLDVLIPTSTDDMAVTAPAPPIPGNPLMEGLKASAHWTRTTNGARAFSSTLNPVLDAFNGVTEDLYGRSRFDPPPHLELFYRAFGWLYDNHPRTAIANLHNLVTPVCVSKKKEGGKAHGYWKDLLNILALSTVDELSNISEPSKFLHSPRDPFTYGRNKTSKVGTPESRISASVRASQRAKADAAAARAAKEEANHARLSRKLSRPKYRALYITVARLFAEQLIEDIKVLCEINTLPPDADRLPLARKLSLAGKWAPTPGCTHDRLTNISTAIAELIYASQSLPADHYPSVLKSELPAHDRAVTLRSFYQRWILTELRLASGCPEPLMSAGRWKQIKYNRVPSLAMKNNTPHFFRHDPEGFEKYLTAVEENKKSISGATLLPHKLVAQAIEMAQPPDARKGTDAMREFKRRLAQIRLRVVEAQWKTLLDTLREAGTLENSLAVCDVSGSMGYLGGKNNRRNTPPILPAVALSLVLASIATPPFAGGFITFSSRPQFVAVDLAQPLHEQVSGMARADWSMTTNLQAVFVDLLLPLAVRHAVRPEDMVKRLFVFSDMQFDACQQGARWETNYDAIAAAYARAGYEVPQIVYWDLSSAEGTWTVEVEGTRKGVAMMNGFSPAMLKVFMGEDKTEPDAAEETEWESVDADGESTTVAEVEEEEEDFTPINVMKKALMRASYDGLVVLD
ncbi:hypothetical protein HYPSUDRAFT_50913 [Hypholoma sublateritium FD-334 SS-4]|uniref:TROVE domain-containing protein n=1 Tax=Hypholoma sublateritium (strain FD-334 SS-4) TaxID=945553 RepID=A0A0D2MXE3_HYPSF|nr:hypothetical protein HYPSUDRAFT_50913 [Hypholoma sublateritium FD-334 SS-4]